MLPLRLPTGHSYRTLFLENHHLGRYPIHATFIHILLCPVSSCQKNHFTCRWWGKCPLLLSYLCFMSMPLLWLHFCSSLVGLHLRLGFTFRLHLWLTENGFMIEGSLKNRRVIGWNQSNSVKLCYPLELRKRYLRWCGDELLCSSHWHSNEGIQMPRYMYNKTM